MNHIVQLARRYDVTVVANATDFGFLGSDRQGISHATVHIERDINLLRDTAALVHMFTFLRAGNFDAVYSVTPKAGLTSMLAAYVARIPVRVHTFTGQVWVTAREPTRSILRAADRLIAALSTHVLVDSRSQMEFLVAEGIVEPQKATVLAGGSISGVDLSRFSPNRAARDKVRSDLRIDESAVVFLFVGRLKKDKGLLDLARAFAALSRVRDSVRLLVVGPDEEKLRNCFLELCQECRDSVVVLDYAERPEELMAAADVLCLPSYREGFGGVIVEAAAVGIPSIGSRIYGITDAIVEGVTGLLHDPANHDSLLAQMLKMVDSPSLRLEMGTRARERAVRDFSSERVTTALVDFMSSVV